MVDDKLYFLLAENLSCSLRAVCFLVLNPGDHVLFLALTVYESVVAWLWTQTLFLF